MASIAVMSFQDDAFVALVRNAINFLNRSHKEFEEGELKHSVIDFYTALELFLKARLLAEHWTLIISGRDKADRKKFEAGDFRSVTLSESIERLSGVIGVGLTQSQKQIFQQLGKHRNQMVHFFHSAEAQEDEELKAKVAIEQLKAWYELHSLLLESYRRVFELFVDDLEQIDRKLRRNNVFLDVIFRKRMPIIQKQVEEGGQVSECPICGFNSLLSPPLPPFIPHEAKCVVCELKTGLLRVKCNDCETELSLIEEGGSCPKCKKLFDSSYIQELLLENETASYFSYDDTHYTAGNCDWCENHNTVFNLGDERYFCCSCFDIAHEISICGWCNEPNTGNMEYSFWSGCSICDGKGGWDSDKD